MTDKKVILFTECSPKIVDKGVKKLFFTWAILRQNTDPSSPIIKSEKT
jgi:hypothetical protein